MKFKPESVVIGERIPIGMMVGAVFAMLAEFYPEHRATLHQVGILATGLAQVIVVNWRGVTVGQADG